MDWKRWSRVFGVLFLCITGEVAMAKDYKKLTEYLDLMAENDKVMLSVAIHQSGQLRYQYQVGFADVKQQKALTTESIFRIGSISKTYTAAIILKLVEAEKLKLTQTLDEFYPSIQHSKNITIKQLLNHTSGIYNFTNSKDYPAYMTQYKSSADLIDIISKYPPAFEPGTRQDYSNSNFVLLALIAEKASGETFENLLEQYIVKPLQMSSTYIGKGTNTTGNEVLSYRFAGNWLPLPMTDLSIPFGAGSILSTASEVSAFYSGLFSGAILSEKSLEMMTELQGHYGLGITQRPFYDRRAYGHGGSIDGFLTDVSYFEHDEVSVAVLSNGVNTNFNDVLIAILSAQFERPFELPTFDAKLVELNKIELETYTGNYQSDALPLDIKVFVAGSSLMAQATGQGPFPLTSYENREFKFDPAGITLVFSEDKKSFVLVQGGGNYLFKRAE